MQDTVINTKVAVLINEDPKHSTFKGVASALGLQGIDPLDFIEPESHMLSEIYKEVFKDELANQLMGYLVNRHPVPLVYDLLDRIHASSERLVVVNTTLLTEEDIKFLDSALEHTLIYALTNSSQRDARNIYDESKAYRDEAGI